MDGLLQHLQRAEIEFIADHGGGYPENFKLNMDRDVAGYLRWLGYRFVVEEGVEPGQKWARLRNGINVSLTDYGNNVPAGLIASREPRQKKAAKKR